MTKKVIERLKNYQLEVDESRKKEVLLLGVAHLKSQKKRISYLELALFTIRFISYIKQSAQSRLYSNKKFNRIANNLSTFLYGRII